MNRRESLKGIAAATLFSFAAGTAFAGAVRSNKVHFVGLGSAGANIAKWIRAQGLKANYSCINWFPSFVEPYEGLNHIEYTYPTEIRNASSEGKRNMPLTKEMKACFSDDCFYILICGLGGFTGTSLIVDAIHFLESRGSNYIAVVTLPMHGEGRFRNQYAQEKIRELTRFRNVNYYDIEKAREVYGELPVSKAFAAVDDDVFQLIRSEALKMNLTI